MPGKSHWKGGLLPILDIAICVCVLFTFGLLMRRKVRTSRIWRATVTPLASIIGSGFLVVAPLLHSHFGKFSAFAMLSLVLLGYLIGSVLRSNIRAESVGRKSNAFEFLSRAGLYVAYTVSVAFYVKLLAAFLLRAFGTQQFDVHFVERCIAVAILLFIGMRGFLRGFGDLETLEEYAVNGKLAVIAGLFVGLLSYNYKAVAAGEWSPVGNWHPTWTGVRVLMGSIIVVQGFETSQFLTAHYSADERVKTMRYSQILSGVIYVVFVSAMLIVFTANIPATDTAIIDLSQRVAPVLPTLLIVAAILSQLSAAVADTIGAGGLLHRLVRSLTPKSVYLPVTLGACFLVWFTDVFQIVAIASRCFAVYYAIECLGAMRRVMVSSKLRAFVYLVLALFLFACAVFGMSAEA